MFDLFFLEANEPLTKTFSLDAKGTIQKSSYPPVSEFTSHREPINTLSDFHKALVAHSKQGHCLIKGTLHRDLDSERRAGATKTEDITNWMCLDFDGLLGWKTIEAFMDEHPNLKDVSYIIQYSSSYGLPTTKGLHAHVFVLLSNPYHAPYLKGWMTKQNIDGTLFKGKIVDQLTLTRTGSALHYPLDITINQNDKLIYIAPPNTLKGVKYKQPEGGFTHLIIKEHKTLPVERLEHGTPAKQKTEADKRFNALRKSAGLDPVRGRMRHIDGFEVMPDCGEFVITGTRDERGFRYFNMNGGDSWSYYHPLNNHTYIHCFKDDRTYLTKNILPSYFRQMEQLKKEQRSKNTEDGTTLLAFRDLRSDTYYNGVWNPQTHELDLHSTKQRAALADFMAQRGSDIGDFIEDWTVEFNPQSTIVCVPEERYLNTYVQSSYMRMPRKPAKDMSECPTIQRIIQSAVSNNKFNEVTEHFLNWLAVIFQRRIKTITGWVLHGNEGTGKGLLANEIIRPLLGRTSVMVKRFSELEEKYTGWLEPLLIAVIDEIQVSSSSRKDLITGDMKNFITENYTTYRNMHTMPYEAPSFVNFLLFSNMPDPVTISETDRRFNVGDFQPDRLVFTVDDIRPTIRDELPAFMDYIMQRPADVSKAREIVKNEARRAVIMASRNTVDIMCDAITEGDLNPFVDALPDTKLLAEIAGASSALGVQYSNIILREMSFLADSKPTTGFHMVESRLSRDELFILLQHTVGNMPATAGKFARMLSHKHIKLTKIRRNDITFQGLQVRWIASEEWVKENVIRSDKVKQPKVVSLKERKKA